MKKVIRVVIFLLVLYVNLSFNMADKNLVVAENIEISSSAVGMAVLEGNTNTLLYSKNSDMRLPMASTTKIVACIVAIENYPNLDKKILVSDKAVGIEGTSIYLKHGEVISMRELLLGLMLASGNDCSVAIAEEVCGLDEFVNKMNEFAIKCGANNTHFVNPHGLDADGHFTTAHDLALMTSYALKNPIFREICGTKKYIIPKTNVYEYDRFLKHKNRIMFIDESCIGVKTGFTDNAKRCLVSATEKDGMQVVSVVLNCQPMFEECMRLDSMAYGEYKFKEFVKPYNYVGTSYVEDGNKKEIGLATINGYSTVIKKSDEEKYRVEYDIPENLTAPIDLNQEVGNVKVYYMDNIIFESPLYTIDSIKNVDLRHKIDSIIEKWF